LVKHFTTGELQKFLVDLTNRLKTKIMKVVNTECELIRESERSRLFITLDLAASNDHNIIQSTLLNIIIKHINSKSERSLGELNDIASDYLLSKYSVLVSNALHEAMSEQPDIDLSSTLPKYQEGVKNDKWTLPFGLNFNSTKKRSKKKRRSESTKSRQKTNRKLKAQREALTSRSRKGSLSDNSSGDPPAPKQIPPPPPLETSGDYSTPGKERRSSGCDSQGSESYEVYSPPPPKEIPSPPPSDPGVIFTLPLPQPHPRVTTYFSNSTSEKRKSSQSSQELNNNTKN